MTFTALLRRIVGTLSAYRMGLFAIETQMGDVAGDELGDSVSGLDQ
jgi:hypothetical protein